MTQANLQLVSVGATSTLQRIAEKWQAHQRVLVLWRRKRTAQRKGQQDLKARLSLLKVEVAQLREEMMMLGQVEEGETVDLFAGINAALDLFQKTENVSRRAAARMLKEKVRKALHSAENELERVKNLQHVRMQDALARQQLREAMSLVETLRQQQARDMALAVKSVNRAARQRVNARMDEIKVAEAALEALKERFVTGTITD